MPTLSSPFCALFPARSRTQGGAPEKEKTTDINLEIFTWQVGDTQVYDDWMLMKKVFDPLNIQSLKDHKLDILVAPKP